MMVTACSSDDDQGQPCPKAPGLSPLLKALEGKENGPVKEKVGAYMTLAERLKNDKDATLCRDICQRTDKLTCLVTVDIMNDDPELSQAALQALGFCLHLPDISRAFTSDDASTVVKALCNTLLKTKDKSTCTRVLWCLSKQNFPPRIIRNELHTVLCVLEHALVQGEFQSMTVEYEALNVLVRLLEDLPDDMPAHSARWGKLLPPLVVRQAHKIRERAATALNLGLPAMLKHQSEIAPSLAMDLKSTLVPEMTKLFVNKNEVQVLKIWCHFVTLLGKTLHKGGSLINCLLGVVEQGFKHSSPDIKLASFVAWKSLIENFALEPDVLYNAKRLKLLMQPLRATNAKHELVAQAKLDTWWYLVYRLGPKTAMYFDQVCAPLLQFTLGLNTSVNGLQCPGTPLASNGSGLRQGFTTPLHRAGPVFSMASPTTPRLHLPPGTPGGASPQLFKSIQLQGVEILARILGRPGDAFGNVPKYHFSIDALDHPVISSSATFIKLAPTLVPTVRDVICSLGDQLDEGLLFHLWYSLVKHVSDMVTTATKKDSVEVLTQFLTGLECIMGASGLTPKTHLRFLEPVSRLPKNVLGSPSYHAGNAGLMHGTPALFLIKLLFSQSLLETTSEERFFCTLETLVDCGLTVPGTVLGFCGSVLQLVDRAAADLNNKGVIWRMWSNIVYPLLGHIIETNEVNQGDSLDHDFSTMYASLLIPIQHMLLSGSLQQTTVKTLLKTWAELYQAFARCTAVVTTADSNLGCEELCCKILASLENKMKTVHHRSSAEDGRSMAGRALPHATTASCVDSMSQILQVIGNSIDFSSFTAKASLNNLLTPGGATRGPLRALGNLTAFVALIVKVIDNVQRLVSAEKTAFAGLLMQSNSILSSPSISNLASVVSTLFTNISQPIIIEALLAKLAKPVSCFYDDSGGFKSSAYQAPTWQKLEKLWTDLLTSIQTRHGGPYTSPVLATVSPLLEAGLTHPKRVVKNHALVFWNATFATAESLEYPDSLKVCLARVNKKTPLVLPGWPDTEQQVVSETPTSQFPESEASQSLIPLPIPTGAPSPQKVHGSFLKRTAQAERLFTATSPERYKNPAPTSTGKRNSSPGRGMFGGLSSPVEGKSKRDGSPAVSGAAARRRLHVDEESMGEFVFIAPSPKKTRALTDHQKEILQTRRVLPALYNDLEQSQDTQTFSAVVSQTTEATQESLPMMEDQMSTTSEESPSLLNHARDETSPSKELQTKQDDQLSEIGGDPETARDVPNSAVEDLESTSETKKTDSDSEIKTLTFAGILSKIKKSGDLSASSATEVSRENTSQKNYSLQKTSAEVESSTTGLKENLLGNEDGEGMLESCVSDEKAADSIPTLEDNLEVCGKEGEAETTRKELKGDVLNEREVGRVEKNEKEMLEGTKEQKVLVKDSTDEESGNEGKNMSAKTSDDNFAIPETQPSPNGDSSKVKEKIVSPVESSKPSAMKLNLTPIIKLQKLNRDDIVRLSPDPSRCSFGKLDINSSPKVFTSSEEEATPNQFTSRLMKLNEKSKAKKSFTEPKAKPKRVAIKKMARGQSQSLGRKSLQSSQADLAELAEKFELDGIEPLADETDMDQSVDLMDTDDQSKGVLQEPEIRDEKMSKGCPDKDIDENGLKEPRIESDSLATSAISIQDDAMDHNQSESYAADESALETTVDAKLQTENQDLQIIPESTKSQEARKKVPKRRLSRKTKEASSSKDNANSLPQTANKQNSDLGDCLSQRPKRTGSKRTKTSKGSKIQKDALDKQQFQEVEQRDQSRELKRDESQALKGEDAKEKVQPEAESSVQQSQDEEKEINSCDDLFESCPQEVSEDTATKTTQIAAKKASSKTKSKLGSRKRTSRSWENAEESEDDIPLAKIKHCYLDVESQTSDSEVDFPKKRLNQTLSSLPEKTSDETDNKTGSKAEMQTETKKIEEELPGKRNISPKTSPNVASARRILKRAKKSPNGNKMLPCKACNVKVAAKISPIATRQRTSKHMQSLSASVPCKLGKKPRKKYSKEEEKRPDKPRKRFKFEEKLEHADLNVTIEDLFPWELESDWGNLSPVAGLSTSLPIPDSNSLLSPSPISFIEEDIHEKDLGLGEEALLLLEVIPPSATIFDKNREAASSNTSVMPETDAVANETLVSNILEPKVIADQNEKRDSPLKSQELPSTENAPFSERLSVDDNSTTVPQSPVLSLKFAPSCHSSPNVRASKREPTPQSSPSSSIPPVYSPSGSPSGGILKRRDIASPSNKSRRVSFAEPISEHSPVKHFAVELASADPFETQPTTSKIQQRSAYPPSPLVTTTPSKVVNVHSKFITTPSRRSSSSGFGARSRISPSSSSRRISPGSARRRTATHESFVTPLSGRKIKHVKQSSQISQGTPPSQATQQNTLDNSIDSDYDNQESVFPDLVECATPVERVLPQLTSSMWSRGLGQLIRARNILTVGHLCSLSPSEVRSLPIRSPKIGNLRKVMANFQKQQAAKSGMPLTSEGAVREKIGGEKEMQAKMSERKSEEGFAKKQDTKTSTPCVQLSSEIPSTSKTVPSQGTKRKHDALESGPQTRDQESPKPKQPKLVDKLEQLVGEFAHESLADMPSDRLFQAHQHVNSMMESIMAALKVKVKSPSLSS